MTITEPLVMGILNVTPDSFYAGSRSDTTQAIEARVGQMLAEDVDIIDIGAYSTRPGAAVVTADEEKARLAQAMEVIHRLAPNVVTSVDTFRADVARYAVEQQGIGIVNDVSGGTLDPQMFATVADLQVPYILMHMRGTPATMQQLTDYDNVVDDVLHDLRGKLDTLCGMGVRDVVVDPGFGFAKTLHQNYELMARLEEFHSLRAPLLVGISRKSMIYKTLNCTPDEALNGTTVLNTVALLAGAHILRVHDVLAAVEARTLIKSMYNKY
jgi:dihydropteroate synthase